MDCPAYCPFAYRTRPKHDGDRGLATSPYLLSATEINTELDKAISTLPPKLKAVFMLREVEGFSTQESADVLDISISAAKVRLHRARLLLREQLANYFAEFVA